MEKKDKPKLTFSMQTCSSDSGQDASENASCKSSASETSPKLFPFCSMQNFQGAVIYLSQELQNLGLKYKLIEANGEKLNLVALINCVWEVMQLYHAAVRDGNNLHDNRRRDIADLNHLQGSVRELREVIEEKKRLLQEAQEKERQVNSINKALASKLKSDKEEIRRLSSIIQQRETQHQHEMRKKETEMSKLQERLHRIVSGERGSELRMSNLTMSGSLHRSDRARGRWRTDNTNVKHEEELYQRVLGQYESWVSQLTEESDLLKECLGSVALKLAKISSKFGNSSQSYSIDQENELLNNSLNCSILSADSLEDDPMFSLNFNLVKDQIQKNLDDNLQLISQMLEKRKQVNDSEELKKKEPNEDEKLGNEDKQSEEDLDSSVESKLESIAESMCVEQEAELHESMKRLTEERRKLQKEREVFAAAAVRLNREKAAFEEEKVELLRHQFLEDLPSSLLNNSKDPFTPNASMENSFNGSLGELYGDSPRTIRGMPTLTSPTGNITHTTQPVTLGAIHLPRLHRNSRNSTPCRTPLQSLSGKSAPASRNSSLSRRHRDSSFLKETLRAKTLERPASSRLLNNEEEGLISHPRSSTCIVSRPSSRNSNPLSCLPSNTSLSQSINCPPLESKKHLSPSSKRNSGDLKGFTTSSRPTNRPRRNVFPQEQRAAGEERESCDSGFYYDHDDYDSVTSTYDNLRDTRTNSRLSALENSLVSLIDKIQNSDVTMESIAKSKETLPVSSLYDCEDVNLDDECSREDGECSREDTDIKDEVSNELYTKPKHSVFSILPSKTKKQTRSLNLSPTCLSLTQPSQEKVFSASKEPTLMGSAPVSLPSSRKSSHDGRTSEDYLKKIQSNFSKWYWK